MIFISKNAKETRKIGEILGRTIRGSAVIALMGDLGAGKTTFVKGLARGLGVKSTVTSPTFLLIKKHDAQKARSAIESFYHIDCYRAQNEKKLQFLGIEEILKNKRAVTVVEWPEKIKKLLPKSVIKIKFSWINENERKISIAD